MRASSTCVQLAVEEEARPDLLGVVTRRVARPPGEREQARPLVDERGDAAHRLELFPARRDRGDRERAQAVHPRAVDLARDPADARRHAVQLDLAAGRLEVQREAAVQLGAPPVAVLLDLRAVGVRRGLAAVEEQRRARPRRPVEIAIGIEEGKGKCFGAHRSSRLTGSSYSVAVPSTSNGSTRVRPPRPPTMRRPSRRATSRRTSARVGGIRRTRPTMSVRKPGRDQEGAAEDDQHAVDQLAVGHAARRHRLVEAAPGRPALGAQEQRAEHGVGREQGDRRDRPDGVADLQDHVQLCERDDDEQRQESQQRHSDLTLLSSFPCRPSTTCRTLSRT